MTALDGERLTLNAARDVVGRLNDPQSGGCYERWVERARGCEHPVRLVGMSTDVDAATGELAGRFTSEGQPDGVLLKPCGNRRAGVCGPCSDVYRGDAWQLVISGLRGGKGVPETVAAHPLVFATFTAPSFGPVHTVRESGGKRLPCRPRSRGETCPHGRSLACGKRHADDDPCLGEAICRTALATSAARCGTSTSVGCSGAPGPTSSASSPARPDSRRRRRANGCACPTSRWPSSSAAASSTSTSSGGSTAGYELAPPPEGFDAQLLADAITAALPKSTVPAEDDDAEPYGWGEQFEVRVLQLGQDADEVGRIAAYIAKYATKSTADAGGASSRIRHEHELDQLRCREHARRLITGAWRLGEDPDLDGKRLPRWAHQFGFGGHCFTKSRRFSTTFKALRQARALHAAGHAATADPDAAKSDHNLIHISAWHFAGRGYPKAGDALLAASSHARAREMRRIAREEAIRGDDEGRAGGRDERC